MNENNFVHYLTKILLEIMFYGGILCCAAVPFIASSAAFYFGYSETMVVAFAIIIFSSGICSLFIIWQLKIVFKSLIAGNPFIPENVSCFRKCAVACFLIGIAFIIDILLAFTVVSVFIVIIFSLLGLFCLTLKDVFKQAIVYKEDQDWTV